jgi:hypothetical protein
MALSVAPVEQRLRAAAGTSEALIYIAMMRLMLRQLAPK